MKKRNNEICLNTKYKNKVLYSKKFSLISVIILILCFTLILPGCGNNEPSKTVVGGDDYYNDDHLNIYGAKKLTHYWGELLTTNYDVSSHKLNETQKKEWDYTVDYTNRFFAKAEQRIKDGTKGAFYETASLKAKLFD